MVISIIIPVYNVDVYIEKCILSIVNQTYKNLEIIFINDGSTDKSLEKIEKYSKQDSRIKIINQKNQGVSAARNNGIKSSNGEYIMFVDPDDFIETNMVDKFVKCINNKRLDLVICNFNIINIDGNSLVANFYTKANRSKEVSYFREEFLKRQLDGYCWNKMYKSEILKHNKIEFKTDIKILEDLFFNFNYLDYVRSIDYINIPLYNYVLRDNSAVVKEYNNIFEVRKLNYNISTFYMEKWNKNSMEIRVKISDRFLKQIYKEIDKRYRNSHSNINVGEIVNEDSVRNCINSLNIKDVNNIKMKIFLILLKIKSSCLINIYYKCTCTIKKYVRWE